MSHTDGVKSKHDDSVPEAQPFRDAVRLMALPAMFVGTLVATPFKRILMPRKRESWTKRFETAVILARRILTHAPRDLKLARSIADFAIPGVLLPPRVYRFKERIQVSDGSYMKCDLIWPSDENVMRRLVKVVPDHLLTMVQSSRVFLYIHGGGFSMCSTGSHRGLLMHMAKVCHMPIYAINYRRPPEFTIADAVDDVIVSLDRMINHYKIPLQNIVIAGDSAGGGLAYLTLLELKKRNRPLPGLAVLICPWVDLSDPGDKEFADIDVLPIERVPEFAKMAAGNLGLSDPRVSPIFANLSGMPPTLIHVGEVEILNSQIKRFDAKLREAGVAGELREWKDMVHVFHQFTILHDTPMIAMKHIKQFIHDH